MNENEARMQKIIVALFLCLDKAMNRLPQYSWALEALEVSESEIREAWKNQTSPVRLISRRSDWGDRTFRVVKGNLDLNKTGMSFKKPMPEEPNLDPLKKGKRCFDLE